MAFTVKFPDNERVTLLALLYYHLQNPAQLPDLEATQRAYGRLLGGDRMTPEECTAAFGPGWYISPTGRKLIGRAVSATPVTAKRWDMAREAAILLRGVRITASRIGG